MCQWKGMHVITCQISLRQLGNMKCLVKLVPIDIILNDKSVVLYSHQDIDV